MEVLIPLEITIFVILSSCYIWKKSRTFFVCYIILFLYTIFSQLGYLFYKDYYQLFTEIPYFSKEIFIQYSCYISLSLLAIFTIFIFFYNKNKEIGVSLQIKNKERKSKNLLYISLILLINIVEIYFLVKNFNTLSYGNQATLKSNKIWFYIFAINGITILSLIAKFKMTRNIQTKIVYTIILLITLSTFLITSIKAGQRIEMLGTLTGIAIFFLFYQKEMQKQQSKKRKRHLIFISITIIVIIGFFQAVRSNREEISNINDVPLALTKTETYTRILDPQDVIFQDWFAPSLSLATSIEKNIIIPKTVIESNIRVLIPFIDHKTLGESISRIIAPKSNQGFGYYILTEGYNLMGFLGFIYSAIVFTFGIFLLEKFFSNTENIIFNSYMAGIIGVASLDIIRGGQIIIFFKILYLYFLPAIILFWLLSNKKIYISKLKKTKIS